MSPKHRVPNVMIVVSLLNLAEIAFYGKKWAFFMENPDDFKHIRRASRQNLALVTADWITLCQILGT